MARWDPWSRRMWWAGPAVVGVIGALGVAAIVVGPELADSVSVPSNVNVGSTANLSAQRVTASHPPPLIVATAPPKPRTGRAPAKPSRPHLQPLPQPTPNATAPADHKAIPNPAPTHVVAPQRPVVESESPDPSEPPGGGGGWNPGGGSTGGGTGGGTGDGGIGDGTKDGGGGDGVDDG